MMGGEGKGLNPRAHRIDDDAPAPLSHPLHDQKCSRKGVHDDWYL
jgi:hypothetical protein